MLWAIKQLCVPVRYLQIKNGLIWHQSKRVYDFVFPALLTIFTALIFYLFGIDYSVFASSELVKRLLDLLSLMIVFYMAALAAVSTFDRSGIDERLKGDDATLYSRRPDGLGFTDKPLTYRQFISYLFGYLSFLSMCLYVFLAVSAFLWPEILKSLSCSKTGELAIKYIASPSMFIITFFSVWQLFITSLLGIYFLTERIQTLNEKR